MPFYDQSYNAELKQKRHKENATRRWENLDKYGKNEATLIRQMLDPSKPALVTKATKQWDARMEHGYYGNGAYRKRGKKRSYSRRRRTYRGRGAFKLGNQIRAATRIGKSLTTKKMRAGMQGKIMQGMGAYYGGRGAYNNLFVDGNGAPNTFAMSSTGDEQNDIVFTNREFIGDIFGNAAGTLFSNASFALNPGVEKTFPWLSQLAVNFTEYEFMQCIFEYEPTVENDVDSAGQTGTVLAATQYNIDDPDFTGKAEMLQYAHSNSGKVTDMLGHGVECDPTKNAGPAIKYVRAAPLPATGVDRLRYDQGTFQLAIHGTPAGYEERPIGELYVSYTVRLSKPKLVSGIGGAISVDRFASNPAAMPLTITSDAFAGTDSLIGSENGIGGKLTQTESGNSSKSVMRYTFPVNSYGNYEITLSAMVEFTDDVVNAITPTIRGNISTISDMYAAGSGASFTAAYQTTSTRDIDLTTAIGTRNVRYQLHVHVDLASGTGENNIDFNIPWVLDSENKVHQWQMVISEYNPSSKSPPEFIDPSGTVINPGEA